MLEIPSISMYLKMVQIVHFTRSSNFLLWQVVLESRNAPENFNTNPDTQMAEMFEPEFGATLTPKYVPPTINPKNETTKNKTQTWDSLDGLKHVLQEKKRTLSQDSLEIPLAVNSKKEDSTQFEQSNRESQDSTANITVELLRNVIGGKLSEAKQNGTYQDEAEHQETRFNKDKKAGPIQKLNLNRMQVILLASCLVASPIIFVFSLVNLLNDTSNLSEKGDELFAQSKYSESLKFYDRALGINERLIGTRLKRAKIYELQGDYARALADCNKVLAFLPDDHQALRQCAWTSLKSKNKLRAKQCAQRLLHLQYSEPQDLLIIMSALAANQEHLRALFFYEKILRSTSDAEIRAKADEAIAHSKKQIAHYPLNKGEQELTSAMKSDSHHKNEYARYLIKFVANRGNFVEALTLSSQLLPKNKPDLKDLAMSTRLKYISMESGLNLAPQAMAKNHKHQKASIGELKTQAFSNYQNGQFLESSENLIQALKQNPGDPELRKFLSYLLAKANLTDQLCGEIETFEMIRSASAHELTLLITKMFDSKQDKLARKLAVYSTNKFKTSSQTLFEIAQICNKYNDKYCTRLAAVAGLKVLKDSKNTSKYSQFVKLKLEEIVKKLDQK